VQTTDDLVPNSRNRTIFDSEKVDFGQEKFEQYLRRIDYKHSKEIKFTTDYSKRKSKSE